MFRINEIYRAIQGEGWHTGLPCTIVRFQGCNLRCEFCDTDYALDLGEGTPCTLAELTTKILDTAQYRDIILITGGEPTLQPIGLLGLDHMHLETNGTRPVPDVFEWVTVSPKSTVNVVSGAMERADEVKWLVTDLSDVTTLGRFLDAWSFKGKVSVQPVSMDPGATRVAYDACLRYGWRLSLQTHKFIARR